MASCSSQLPLSFVWAYLQEDAEQVPSSEDAEAHDQQEDQEGQDAGAEDEEDLRVEEAEEGEEGEEDLMQGEGEYAGDELEEDLRDSEGDSGAAYGEADRRFGDSSDDEQQAAPGGYLMRDVRHRRRPASTSEETQRPAQGQVGSSRYAALPQGRGLFAHFEDAGHQGVGSGDEEAEPPLTHIMAWESSGGHSNSAGSDDGPDTTPGVSRPAFGGRVGIGSMRRLDLGMGDADT